MSIADKTIGQLVLNRVHDLSDIVMEMNIKQGRKAGLTVTADGVSLWEKREDALPASFYTPLPPSMTPQRALEGLEKMLEDVRTYTRKGGAQ
ncbi:hypothetical protein [Vreelandella olivaria]|uniref:hypothetical protein n=1 Tax=Vreelandella olivaria TaxID=390919 RepID=UPI00201E7628|nr:hypothetical protein [Halomonas olivaria]